MPSVSFWDSWGNVRLRQASQHIFNTKVKWTLKKKKKKVSYSKAERQERKNALSIYLMFSLCFLWMVLVPWQAFPAYCVLTLLFWDGSRTLAAHWVCLFTYSAMPVLILRNICLHSTRCEKWVSSCMLISLNFFTKLLFYMPFAISSHPAPVSWIRKAASGGFSKGASHSF